jgi:multidrug resistance efflux pump
VVLALVVWFWLDALRHAPAAANDAAAPSAPSVKTVAARSGEYLDRIAVAGRVGAPAGSSAKIAFAQPGIVASIDVHVGDAVAAGQTLATLDRSTLAASLAQAQADARSASASFGGGSVPAAGSSGAGARLALAEAKLATLRQGGPAALSSRIAAESSARQAAIKVTSDQGTIDRDVQLLAAGVIAQKDLDAARAQLASDQADQRALDAKVSAADSDFQAAVKQAEADVTAARNDVATSRAQGGVLGGQAASAQAKLAAARIAYAKGVLVAPASGVVLSIAKHPGESVDVTQPVMEIGPSFERAVTLAVPGDTALRIRPGYPVVLKLQNRAGAQADAVVAADAARHGRRARIAFRCRAGRCRDRDDHRRPLARHRGSQHRDRPRPANGRDRGVRTPQRAENGRIGVRAARGRRARERHGDCGYHIRAQAGRNDRRAGRIHTSWLRPGAEC